MLTCAIGLVLLAYLVIWPRAEATAAFVEYAFFLDTGDRGSWFWDSDATGFDGQEIGLPSVVYEAGGLAIHTGVFRGFYPGGVLVVEDGSEDSFNYLYRDEIGGTVGIQLTRTDGSAWESDSFAGASFRLAPASQWDIAELTVRLNAGPIPRGGAAITSLSLVSQVDWFTANGGDVEISPLNGLTIEGPTAPTTVATLSVGTLGVGFAELRLRPSGPLTAVQGTTIQDHGRVSGGGALDGPVTIEAGGEIVALTGDDLVLGGPVTNGGQITAINATLTFAGDGDPNGDNADGLVNNASLSLINATINGDVYSPAGSTIDVASGVEFNGLVSGGGDFPGAGSVTLNGGYSPGDSPASVSMAGDLTLGDTNTLTIELGGTQPGEFDQLLIDGDASLAGVLDLVLLDGYAPTPGDSFTILSIEGSQNGQFIGLDEGGLVENVGGIDLFITYAGGDGNDVALFTAVPEPGSLLMMILATAVMGLRDRRLPHRRVAGRPDRRSNLRRT